MPPIDWSSAIASGVNAFGGLLGSGLSQSYNRENMALQNQYAKELMDYQWRNFQSPEAQVAAMTRAGLNPAVLFGSGGKGAFAAPSPSMPSSSPVQVPNVFDISSAAAFIKSVADAKKAGMDTKLSEQEIKNKEVERQLNEFNLDLQKQFGKSFKSVELEKAYKDLLLSVDSHDLNVQEKALNEWKIATEKAVTGIKESEREMAFQRLANNPTAISLENELMKEKAKTERAQQSQSYAAAKSSIEQANVNRELRRLNSALADVEENTKFAKIESLIAEYEKNGWLSQADANDARLRASRIHSVENRRDNSSLFKAVDDFSEWLKSKVRIFN